MDAHIGTARSKDDQHDANFVFSPPLYYQRYSKVISIIQDPKWINSMRRVVDFGCAEFRFLTYLKALPFLHEAIGVDVDGDVLRDSACMLSPRISDYVLPRKNCALNVFLMRGSVADFDHRLGQVDAVTAIELIEHLEPSDLAALPKTVFGCMKPKLVIITTPNQEFNVHFTNFKGPFRHWDHKFEWTRAQFEGWCQGIVDIYPDYMVQFFGIGSHPTDPEATALSGSASQGATFMNRQFYLSAQTGDFHPAAAKMPNCSLMDLPDSDEYTTLAHHCFPVLKDDRSTDDKIYSEASYATNRLIYTLDQPEQIFLTSIFEAASLNQFGISLHDLRRVLESRGLSVTVDVDQPDCADRWSLSASVLYRDAYDDSLAEDSDVDQDVDQ